MSTKNTPHLRPRRRNLGPLRLQTPVRPARRQVPSGHLHRNRLPAEKEVRNLEDAAMKYKNIDHIVITTKNFEACLPIYVDILGMKA